MWSSIRNWAISSWNNRRGLAVIVFLSALVAFPTLTYFLFKWAFGSGGASTGVTGSPLSFPWLFLGFASLVGAVFASNNTQSQVSYGVLGLAFFCFILAIGPDYPLNVRLGKILDQVLSSQGLALLAMSGGVAFALKNTTNPTSAKILVGVLGIMAFTFAIPLLKGAIDPTRDGFRTLTGLELNLNVVLLLTVIGILWKGDVQNRFVRFLLWMSLIIFIPASIAAGVKVIKRGFKEFANEVSVLLTNIPTHFQDSTPDWLKELWAETVPHLKGLPWWSKWVGLGLVAWLVLRQFKRRARTAPPTGGSGNMIPSLLVAIPIAALLIIIGCLYLQDMVLKDIQMRAPSATVTVPGRVRIPIIP